MRRANNRGRATRLRRMKPSRRRLSDDVNHVTGSRRIASRKAHEKIKRADFDQLANGGGFFYLRQRLTVTRRDDRNARTGRPHYRIGVGASRYLVAYDDLRRERPRRYLDPFLPWVPGEKIREGPGAIKPRRQLKPGIDDGDPARTVAGRNKTDKFAQKRRFSYTGF